jgi:hypothetical protein
MRGVDAAALRALVAAAALGGVYGTVTLGGVYDFRAAFGRVYRYTTAALGGVYGAAALGRVYGAVVFRWVYGAVVLGRVYSVLAHGVYSLCEAPPRTGATGASVWGAGRLARPAASTFPRRTP